MAPSMTRWSHEMVIFMRRPTRSWPPSATGFSSTEPTATMAPSGGLMLAENSSTSYMPRLDTESARDQSRLEGAVDAEVRAMEDAKALPLELGVHAGILEESERARLDDHV